MALEVKSHWTIAMSGEGVDEINLVNLLTELIQAQKLKVEITSSNVSTYYTVPSKPKAAS